MSINKELVFNAFNMNCVSHINHGLWTHPRDTSIQYKTLKYWTDLARQLEGGLFDGIFIADITGVYDVYQQSTDLTLKESIQLPVNDPLLLAPAMAGVTEHLGFGITSNVTYEQPYLFARRMSTLDHLTNGRIGWNIVTGYLESAAKALGLEQQVDHDRRYELAEDYMQLVYKLWERSWEEGAVRADRDGRVYADSARVHRIHHQGEFFRSEGYHLCEPSPQRTPVLFQAGSSPAGIAFGGRHAEGVFVTGSDQSSTASQVKKLRQAAVNAGRQPDDVKVLMGINILVAETEQEAREKYDEYLRYANPEAGLAHFSSSTGIDLSQFDLDEPIQYRKTNAIESATQKFAEKPITRRQLLQQHALGGRYTTLIGDPQQVADALQGWVNETGLDGFNLARTVTPECYGDFIRLVVPELQSRGLYKTAYRNGTLREKLFNRSAELPADHAAKNTN